MLTYDETLEFLDSFINYERIGPDRFKKVNRLSRMSQVLETLGHPEHAFRSVHIVGTKGKGSVSTFTSSILQNLGFHVGLFTSPHLESLTERIKVDGKDISKNELVHVVRRLRKCIGQSIKKRFTFFEVHTLIAILYFGIKRVDFAVFEAGMGGRLDATNTIHGEVSGITPISYDHVEVLGKKLGTIAGEKAAVIKQGTNCVSAPQRPSALRVIKSVCKEKDASFTLVGRDISYNIKRCTERGSLFDLHTKRKHYNMCFTRMIGDFQISNCAAAVGICEDLLDGGNIDTDRVRKGIGLAFIPGRMEILHRKPMVMIDGAQNRDSARKLKCAVKRIFGYDRLILVLGVSRDKDVKGICEELSGLADHIILTRAAIKRALEAHHIKKYIRNKCVDLTTSVKEALDAAFRMAQKKDMILATGSFYLIGEVRKALVRYL